MELFGIEHGIEPRLIDPPAADAERARRLAQRGKPVTAMLRAFPLAHGRVLDRLLEELPRLTSDAQSINAAARKLIALSTQYMDRTAETGVLAFQEERDRRVQWRLSVVNEASALVGTTLDIARTAQELADLATERFADAVTVDLLDTSSGDEPPAKGTLVVRRVAQRSVTDGSPETTYLEAIYGEASVPPKQLHRYPDGSPQARALVTGRPSRRHLGPSASILLVPLCARGTRNVALLLARTHTLGDRQVSTWALDADPAEVARARASVSEQLTTWGLEELDFTTELVVSELVTNAIRYGRPPIQLRLIHDRTLMCEVADAGSTTPHLRRARVFDEGGRGLFLVAQLTERWGTRHARHGKTVWAECTLPAPELFAGAAALDVEEVSGVVGMHSRGHRQPLP